MCSEVCPEDCDIADAEADRRIGQRAIPRSPSEEMVRTEAVGWLKHARAIHEGNPSLTRGGGWHYGLARGRIGNSESTQPARLRLP